MAKNGFSHEPRNSAIVDWWTPAWIFEALQLEFDLDPCSPPGGVPWVPASAHYSLPEDGLTLPWSGRIWCNPPYGNATAAWLRRMGEHRNGVALVFSRTDCRWFHESIANADAILFLRGRVKFVDARTGRADGQGAGAGSLLAAWGYDNAEALAQMKRFGMFLYR